MTKKTLTFLSALLFPILLTVFQFFAHAQDSGVVVIEGGTLIDGNGGPPVQNSLIVIRGNNIESVSRKGQTVIPPGATVIKADGKYVLPGLMDGHMHYNSEWLDELFIVNGVTSVFDIGGGEDWGLVQRDALAHGKLMGPRFFLSIGSMAGGRIAELGGVTEAGGPLRNRQVVMTSDKAREVTKRFIDARADLIKVHRGPPIEVYQAAAEEAHKVGLPVMAQPLGPTVYGKEAATAGVDIIEHAAGISYSIAKDPSKWKGWGNLEEHSLDPSPYADMDDAKAAEMIQLLVQKHITLEPDFVCQGRGLQKRRDEYELQDYRMLHLPALAYLPQETRLKWLDNYTEFDDVDPAVRESRIKGLHNMEKFILQFVRAGGNLYAGTDASGNGWAVAGLGLNHELDMMVYEVGLTPMQAIMAATHNTAAAFRMLDKLGTVEAGKLADLIVVNADPLQDVRNLQQLDKVIKDGKVIDRQFHAGFRNPLPLNAVEGATWVEALKKEDKTMRTTSFGQPSPGIETVAPSIVTEGSPTVIVKIKGVGFTKRSRVSFDNLPVPATLVDGSELDVTIDAHLIAQHGTFPIVVSNPAPLQRPQWGGTSNRAYLLVNFKY